MLYAVLFEDDVNQSGQRSRHLAAHLAFLQSHGDQIQAAGPLNDAVTGDPIGGLWLVEADSPQAVQALVEADPLWPTGLRKSVRWLSWRQVFANG